MSWKKFDPSIRIAPVTFLMSNEDPALAPDSTRTRFLSSPASLLPRSKMYDRISSNWMFLLSNSVHVTSLLEDMNRSSHLPFEHWETTLAPRSRIVAPVVFDPTFRQPIRRSSWYPLSHLSTTVDYGVEVSGMPSLCPKINLVASSLIFEGGHVESKSSTFFVQISTLSTAGSKLGTKIARLLGTPPSVVPDPDGEVHGFTRSRHLPSVKPWLPTNRPGSSATNLIMTKDGILRNHLSLITKPNSPMNQSALRNTLLRIAQPFPSSMERPTLQPVAKRLKAPIWLKSKPRPSAMAPRASQGFGNDKVSFVITGNEDRSCEVNVKRIMHCEQATIRKYTNMYIYIHIYIFYLHIHTHTHVYIYMYLYRHVTYIFLFAYMHLHQGGVSNIICHQKVNYTVFSVWHILGSPRSCTSLCISLYITCNDVYPPWK